MRNMGINKVIIINNCEKIIFMEWEEKHKKLKNYMVWKVY